MVAMDMGSFLAFDLGVSLDTLVLAMVLAVLVLAAYQATVLIAAMLATRAPAPPAARPSGVAEEAGPAR